MSTAALALVLLAAVAHASWNLLSKQAASSGAACFVWLLADAASCLYAPVVAIVAVSGRPHLMSLNWLFLAGTGVLQAAYFLFLQLGYRLGDLSLVYPIGRGTGALLAALAGVLILHERPGPVAITGICLIIGGIVAIGLPADRPVRGPAESTSSRSAKAVAFALCTGAFIASYTVWDKYAVGPLHTPPMLQGYAAFPIMVVVFAPMAVRDRVRLSQVCSSVPRCLPRLPTCWFSSHSAFPLSARSPRPGRSASCLACCWGARCWARPVSAARSPRRRSSWLGSWPSPSASGLSRYPRNAADPSSPRRTFAAMPHERRWRSRPGGDGLHVRRRRLRLSDQGPVGLHQLV